MQKHVKVMFFLVVFLILSACNNVDRYQPEGKNASTSQTENQPEKMVNASTNPTENKDYKAKIKKVDTDLEEKDGWYIVPNGVNTMTISVEVENVDTILFWIAETGTGTWDERQLIGYDIDGSDGWSITWEFGDRIFHDHIAIQALGSDGSTQVIETINVHSVDENDRE
ncbi:hypothetical protein [Fervidibacillus albus]|uniref:Lipoprotein n=1 Tax=Fervidibacillus albus TaxID=2980026 RepID=A0A9E8LT92_9BACI|nr:hypothetical protein [Fervidibacillus albus]WAA08975.1 hypothetical protein OE104_10220 [Fervidibacillus albus]